MLQPYYEIVEKQRGEMVVSHRTIAEYTGIKERSISRLITEYRANLERAGTLRFKIAPPKIGASQGFDTAKTYFLNEQQATFLMTLLRNTPKVVEFKEDLVYEFFQMRNQIMRQLKYTKDGKSRIQSFGAHKANYKRAKNTIVRLRAQIDELEALLEWTETRRRWMYEAVYNRDRLLKEVEDELAWYKEKTKNFRFGSYR